ncbi:MAG: sigma 54-interacting transcriptional regulator, partial [Spirochaetota bacterium]
MRRRMQQVTFHGMVGNSRVMRRLYKRIRKVAPYNIPVLISGESGTGKELVARAVHAESDRRSGPFHAVNTGALTLELINSELFGHEKGSFTG